MLLSGGVDSSACIDFYCNLCRPVVALHVDYRQGAAEQERAAAERIATFFQVPLLFRRLDFARAKSVGEIEARNGFLVLTAAMECPPSIRAIAVGIHSGTGYPDCTPAFLEAINGVLQIERRRIEVLAPFLDWSKADILCYCEERGVPLHLTYSCEEGGVIACGRCASCLDRKRRDARA